MLTLLVLSCALLTAYAGSHHIYEVLGYTSGRYLYSETGPALGFFDGRYLYDPVGREIGLPIRPLHLRQQRRGHDLWYTIFC